MLLLFLLSFVYILFRICDLITDILLISFCLLFLSFRERDGEVTERYKYKWTVPLRDVELKVNSSIPNVRNSLSLWTGDSVSALRMGKASLFLLIHISS